MASAKRLMELRHDCRSNNRMAEISVPAWPIPIHHTKLTMANPQPTGNVHAPDTDAPDEQVADGVEHAHGQQERQAEAEYPAIRDRPGKHDRADLVGNRGKGVSRLNDRGLHDAGLDFDRIVHALSFHLRIRVADLRQVRGARPGIQVGQEAIVASAGLQFRDPAVGIVDIAKDDGIGRA